MTFFGIDINIGPGIFVTLAIGTILGYWIGRNKERSLWVKANRNIVDSMKRKVNRIKEQEEIIRELEQR